MPSNTPSQITSSIQNQDIFSLQSNNEGSSRFIDRAKKIFSPAASPNTQIIIERGEGSHLFDVNGKRYIDFASGIAISPIGHCHPRVVEAIKEQADTLISSVNFLWQKKKIELAEKLISIFPKSLDSVFLTNSGTEAIEGAMKLARKAKPGRPNFIAFNGGFHGRSFGALSVTASKASYRADFFPLLSQAFFVDYPYKVSVDEVFEQLDKLFETSCPASSVSAIIVECILGEGGYVIPPQDFLPRLRTLCDKHEILLILDEVQSGFGRTGKWFACEHTETRPDILAFAKGIASGMPLGGFAASQELMSKLGAGSHGTTFGGNPISCAASIATIKVIEQEALMERATLLGSKIQQRLKSKFGEFFEIRGQGLMIGIEPKLKALNVKTILERAQSKGLIALSCGPNGSSIRLMPPLNIADETLNEGLNILEQIFDYEVLVAGECRKYSPDQSLGINGLKQLKYN